MKVFLVGFMGSGKTTLGRKLAARLNCKFIDLDEQFELLEGMTIAQYFSKNGEAKFRERESEVLKTTEYYDTCVISTGGGLPCFYDNMAWMKDNGKVIYIQLSPKALASRLEHFKDERPLLHNKHGEDLVNFIAEKLAEREDFYKQANVVAEGLSMTAERLEDIILNS